MKSAAHKKAAPPAERKLRRLLVANRGEIAVRLIRAAREYGLETVAVYSDADAGALHARIADRRVALGGNSARETYLNREKVINAAIQSGADAVHPGYGFFAENAGFAEAVRAAGLCFVGPSPEVIALMGDKDAARKKAVACGVPVVPGSDAGLDAAQLKAFSAKAGYPVMIKAVAGGSGRGMRLVEKAEELEAKLGEAQAEALAAFANSAVIVEKYVQRPRHIEVQIFGDSRGKVLHFGERECSLQRRHQKVVEEAPAARFHPKLRERMCEAAVKLGTAVGYEGAGTVEFLVEGGESADSPFYFLEMNTRIQVEHAVTEAVTGFDLVQLQFHVAEGKPLEIAQKQIRANGHAFEFRIYAEDSTQGFKPATGKILYVSSPGGPGIREDSWVEAGTKVSAFYDSLLSKLTVWGATREEAILRAERALSEFVLEGVQNTLGFHRWLVLQPDFRAAQLDVKWIEREYRGETLSGRAVGPLELPPPPQA